MGYFSTLDLEENRMDIDLKNNMICIIQEVYPHKKRYELLKLRDAQLRGLYGQAKKRLKEKNKYFMPYVIEELDEYAIPGEDGFSRNGKRNR